MKPSKNLVGKKLSSSSVMEGTNHLKKNPNNILTMDVVVIGASFA
jgi:hypothetical protein